ncbi:DUF58 domain-containing protein [candidate division WOR-3 bacterium]|uniref:DUF58 domain-containing protein n=1 Tax=candidate division WOR-3 bacterium TaxID=2052148 RepID=A0A660SHM9_UNCW3|nr:MAG: DUF58 domain-containing protein [candidate division WOR-3 bacterium]
MGDPTRYLKPEVVAGLKRIDLKARLIVEGFIAGLHRSPYRGRSVEFADFRTYNPGDDPKSIDWKIYARTDRYYVKEYEERTNLKAYLLLDRSGSMAYGEPMTKFDYGAALLASIGYLLLRQRDSVGIGLFDERMRAVIPPSNQSHQLRLILELLDRTQPSSRTGIADAIAEISARIRRRGMIILCSDLLADPEPTISSITLLRGMKNEVIVFMILSPDELGFPFSRPVRFRDLEEGDELLIEPRRIRDGYRRRLEGFIHRYERDLLAQNIDFMLVTTDTPFDRALLTFLEKRRRMWHS